MKILYHVFQYHYIFHGWIVTRSPPPLLYELLARCAWANRRIYVAKWWMVCLDPSLMNWDVLIWYHLTLRLMFDLCSSWFSLSNDSIFHFMGACELYGATAVVTLAPKSSEPSVYALHPGCFGASVGQQQVFVFRKLVLLHSRKVNVVQSVLWISWQLDFLESVPENICPSVLDEMSGLQGMIGEVWPQLTLGQRWTKTGLRSYYDVGNRQIDVKIY